MVIVSENSACRVKRSLYRNTYLHSSFWEDIVQSKKLQLSLLDYSEDTDWKRRNPYGWPPNQCRYQWPENKHVQSIYQKSWQFYKKIIFYSNTNLYEFFRHILHQYKSFFWGERLKCIHFYVKTSKACKYIKETYYWWRMFAC